MPMLASNYIPEGMTLVLQSENGVLGLVSISELICNCKCKLWLHFH